jgi:hypothetical protein
MLLLRLFPGFALQQQQRGCGSGWVQDPARFVTCPSHAGNKMEQMLRHQFKTLLMVALSHIKSSIGRSW